MRACAALSRACARTARESPELAIHMCCLYIRQVTAVVPLTVVRCAVPEFHVTVRLKDGADYIVFPSNQGSALVYETIAEALHLAA